MNTFKKDKSKEEKAVSSNKDKVLTTPILEYKAEELQKKIEELSLDLKFKDGVIKKFKQQLHLANQVISELNQEVDSNLQTIYKLYENLIPTRFPTISDCEFSYKFISSLDGIGKDFYQVIPLQRKHFGLLMSSCISRILSSLLFSSRLRLMESKNYKTLRPHEVILNLAQEMSKEDGTNEMEGQVDIFYSILNQKKYSLSYFSVGSIYAFIYSFNNKELYELKSSLRHFNENGIQKSSSNKAILQPRDHLILCSPGVVNGMNKKKQSLGAQKLKEIICEAPEPGAHSLRNHILYQVKKFYNNEEVNRDQSILVMEVRDKILRLT